jgi:hypothetical protein
VWPRLKAYPYYHADIRNETEATSAEIDQPHKVEYSDLTNDVARARC